MGTAQHVEQPDDGERGDAEPDRHAVAVLGAAVADEGHADDGQRHGQDVAAPGPVSVPASQFRPRPRMPA